MTNQRIAFLKSSFRVSGGLEKYCLRIASALRRAGHTVDILSTTLIPELGVFSICSHIKPSFAQLLWFDFHCRRYLREHQYDVIFGFDRHFLPLTHYRAGNGCHKAYLARRFGQCSFLKKIALRLNPLHLFTLFSETCTFEWFPGKQIICNSDLVREEILQYYPKVPKDRLVVIHNGVEWAEFSLPFEKREKKIESPEILFIGHEWNRKGLEKLLQALAQIKDLPFHLTAIGKEKNYKRFDRLSSSLGLSDRVTLIPKACNALPYLQTSQLLAIPSLYDPFANVTVEALAMGLFVVTTKANGGSEVIKDEVNGIVLEENCSITELSSAIKRSFLVIREPKVAEKIRQSIQYLDFEKSLQNYLKCIDSSLL